MLATVVDKVQLIGLLNVLVTIAYGEAVRYLSARGRTSIRSEVHAAVQESTAPPPPSDTVAESPSLGLAPPPPPAAAEQLPPIVTWTKPETRE